MLQTPSIANLNGPLRGYSIEYKEEGKSLWTTVNVSDSSTDETLQSLKKWTLYFIRIAVSNGDFLGPPGPEKQARTLEDGLLCTPWLKLFYFSLFFLQLSASFPPWSLPKQEITPKKNYQKGCNWLSPLSLLIFSTQRTADVRHQLTRAKWKYNAQNDGPVATTCWTKWYHKEISIGFHLHHWWKTNWHWKWNK